LFTRISERNDEIKLFEGLTSPRGLDPLYFNRWRSLEGALSRYAKPVHRIIDVPGHLADTAIESEEWFPDLQILAFSLYRLHSRF